MKGGICIKKLSSFVPFILLLVGIVLLGLYLFTGNRIIDDNFLISTTLLVLVLTFITSLFSKKDFFQKFSCIISVLLFIIFIAYFAISLLFWSTP
ncbi:hypothetical protein BCJMU51_0892 [Bacillus cereus]|uniref:DUF3953 domain-containing protein n=1 Tax=Bacillus thuringiensis subsp. konkukian (strain 97-27) TaxID=281309 RepID=Q6HML6_BACHK|nr:conserved hypothetical protein [[Bacillus thuringiensis] serovar konkukian str. 97-27]BCB36023.1 hypothetical protein BCM0045_0918 [Bacillus cereus]BCB98835.1 hypothetical protein BCM0057_0918 [Bacillus cereus]BCC22330.1 hypothetical protein BCM0079_0923 [Bacillus cereus]BCC33939.1 hypothetical protein BCM0105_0929 [Bacillus cereus]